MAYLTHLDKKVDFDPSSSIQICELLEQAGYVWLVSWYLLRRSTHKVEDDKGRDGPQLLARHLLTLNPTSAFLPETILEAVTKR